MISFCIVKIRFLKDRLINMVIISINITAVIREIINESFSQSISKVPINA